MSTKTYKKLSVVKLTSNVSEATQVTVNVLRAPTDDEVLIKNIYAGVNAADVIVTAGQLFTDGKLPFTFGFEGLGVVSEVGKNIKDFQVGQPVLTFDTVDPQGYAEYQYFKPNGNIIALPELSAEYIGATVGLTSCIGLDMAGQIKAGEKVFITAAAGGIGHICVQWAKQKGCHVIGMTSSPEKAKLLKGLGCDRVINYKTENLDEVLTKEYPEGIDVIWETIGGQVFQTLLKHLALMGRLVLIGSITGYKSGSVFDVNLFELSMKLMVKSNAMIGFSLPNHSKYYTQYMKTIVDLIKDKKLKAVVDFGQSTNEGQFTGIESIVKGIDYLQSGRNCGKVLVKIQNQ